VCQGEPFGPKSTAAVETKLYGLRVLDALNSGNRQTAFTDSPLRIARARPPRASYKRIADPEMADL